MNNEITLNFKTGEVLGQKYIELINKAYDMMNKADFKDYTLELISFMAHKINVLEKDCDRLEETANEALDELERLLDKYNELLDKYFNK